jgi:SAM-dependent methyltransferase
MSHSNDKGLRIYQDVFELERMHYGMWQPDEGLSYDNLKAAQQRYETFLIEHVPEGASSILDVGCGTGVMTRVLLAAGFEAEGLSPDIHQKRIFTEKCDAPFHHTTFDDFVPARQYDCLIMSESAQYINSAKLFANARTALGGDGHLLICDYFVLENATGIFRKSGHDYEPFLQEAEREGWELVENLDITEQVVKTLDAAMLAVNKLRLTLQIISERSREKHPKRFKLLNWLFRKKIDKYEQQILLLDSKRFSENKTYRFLKYRVSGA